MPSTRSPRRSRRCRRTTPPSARCHPAPTPPTRASHPAPTPPAPGPPPPPTPPTPAPRPAQVSPPPASRPRPPWASPRGTVADAHPPPHAPHLPPAPPPTIRPSPPPRTDLAVHWRTPVPHRPRLDLRDAAEVRVLGAERVRRPRRLHDRAAHRLAAALQLPPRADRGGLRLRVRADADPLRGQLRRGQATRGLRLLRRPARRDRAPEGDRGLPPRHVASRGARQVADHRRSSLRRPRRGQHRLRLAQGRVREVRPALARARRALRAHRGVHLRAARPAHRERVLAGREVLRDR